MKIALGTVQFGLQYGISNNHGQVLKSEVKSILNLAHKNGITTLDTAVSYGKSEEVLGSSLSGNEWNIITKTPHFKSQNIDISHVELLEQTFIQSLNNLGLKNISGLLLHNCNDLFKPGGEKLYRRMEMLKSKGAVKKIGVSVYSGEQIDCLLQDYDVDIVQLPLNILDQRLINSGHLIKLKQNNVEIYARSVFLQGLLLMPLYDIPNFFNPVMRQLKIFKKIAEEKSMSSLELALAFVSGINEVNSIVVGVNSLEHLQQIIDASSAHVNPEEFKSLSISDPNFLNPTLWAL